MKEKIFKILKDVLNILTYILVLILVILLSILLINYLANGYIEDNKNIIAFVWALTGCNTIIVLIKNIELEFKKKEAETNTDKILKEIKQELKAIKRKM